MNRATLALLVFALGAGSGLGAGAARWRRPPGDPFAAKRELVLNRSKDMPDGGLLVLGDSIVERQRFETLCGLPVFNAGIGSARLKDIEPIVPGTLLTRPSRAVVAIGANDFHQTPQTAIPDFRNRLDALLNHLPPRPVLVGIPDAPEADAVIRQAAGRHHGTYVEAVPDEMTEDGLHLNPVGLREWKRRVNAAC